MEQYEAIPTESDRILVTSVPRIRQFQFTDMRGQRVSAPVTLGKGSDPENLAELLADIYLAVGQGTYSQIAIHDASGIRHGVIFQAMRRIGRHMPDEVARYIPGDNRHTRTIQFGKIAIASRKPTAEEMAQHRQRSKRPRPT